MQNNPTITLNMQNTDETKDQNSPNLSNQEAGESENVQANQENIDGFEPRGTQDENRQNLVEA